MYLGNLVEVSGVDELYTRPRHPYTIALLSAVPDPDPRIRKKRIVLRGDVPSPAAPPPGCRFHTRCWLRERLGNPEDCETIFPVLTDIGNGHRVACHHIDQIPDDIVAQAVAAHIQPEPPAVIAAAAAAAAGVGDADRSPYAPPVAVGAADPPASGDGQRPASADEGIIASPEIVMPDDLVVAPLPEEALTPGITADDPGHLTDADERRPLF